MWFQNGYIFTPGGFRTGDFQVVGDRFGEVLTGSGSGVDLGGLTVLPGLVDIHTHGNSGKDFSDGDPEGLRTMGEYLARHGITSFAPTSMTLPYERLQTAFETAAELKRHRPEGCARVLGVNMEGPYLSRSKRGAQNPAFLQDPDREGFFRLNREGIVCLLDVAPELPGALELIREAAQVCTVSLAHTAAGYEAARQGLEAGASHVTHLFNGMSSLHHREPGVIGAASEREKVTAELICDGFHVHPSAVRLAFRLFPGRICLISDALRCCGMADGEYELGGQAVTLREGVARLSDGTLAGASANLWDDLRKAVQFGIPPEEAVFAATRNPARAARADQEVGSIEKGRLADFLVCDREWNLRQVYLGGKALLP